MGNRAVITTEGKEIGVYLHWNGGRDSVNAFLAYCRLKGYRCPEYDDYGWARLCQVIGNFFGDTTSVGINRYEKCDRDNFDNGVYVIKEWNVIGRIYCKHEQAGYDLTEFLMEIDNHMPEKERVGRDAIMQFVTEHGDEYGYDVVVMEE